MRIITPTTLGLLASVIFGACANPLAKNQKIAGRKDSVGTIQSVDSTPISMARPDTSIDPKYQDALRFLASIRKADVEKMGRQAYFRQFPGYAIDSFLNYFSGSSFSISDMEKGDSDNERYSMEELKRELTRRKGPAFDILAQMGYIYSIPYPQYSKTEYTIRSDSMGIDVNMAGNYLLSFTKGGDSGSYRLSRVESDHISDQ